MGSQAVSAQGGSGSPLGLYLHVPFCSTRCGYCDFNTYTASELGDAVSRESFADVLGREIELAASTVGDRPVATVFVGGGTPTLLGAHGLGSLLATVRASFDVLPGAEVTTEANPDSVDEPMLEALRASGFTRISFGMQSSAPHVLRTLDRTHTPGAGVAAARAARRSGFEHVSIDLIYGTPGETDDDLRRSIDDALSADVDHLSAYALIVEEGTPLARRVHRGELPAPDDDVAAGRYLIVDDMLTQAGLPWYEVSNWARPGGECRHNLGYWHDLDWWGVGPGAHSHIGDVRWWNVKHPRTYAMRLASGAAPEEGRETLSAQQRALEQVMLGMRLAEGLPVAGLDAEAIDEQVAEGLVERTGPRIVLTRRGRLLADAVVRRLAPVVIAGAGPSRG